MFNYEYWFSDLYPTSVNMALEEYFLRRATKGGCLRLWSVPQDAAVLGYSQATDVIKSIESDFNVVRRASGGSHIQIGPNILAYTVTVPRDGTFKHYEDMRAYYADKIAKSLENLGVQNITVDNKASTINVDGKVVASHAVVWGVNSALLHGLIVIDPYNVDKLSNRLALGSRKIGKNVFTEYSALKNIPAVSQLLDKEERKLTSQLRPIAAAKNLNREQRTEALKKILSEEIKKTITEGAFENKQIGTKILAKAHNLIQQKYGQEKWTNLKKPAFTKQEIEEIPGEKLDGPLKKNLGYCLYIQVKNKDFKRMVEPTD